jgi:hypothetical protein
MCDSVNNMQSRKHNFAKLCEEEENIQMWKNYKNWTEAQIISLKNTVSYYESNEWQCLSVNPLFKTSEEIASEIKKKRNELIWETEEELATMVDKLDKLMEQKPYGIVEETQRENESESENENEMTLDDMVEYRKDPIAFLSMN